MVARLARAKAEIVAVVNRGRWVIAADTTVAVDHHLLGKPADPEDAARMLMLIQGRAHQVHTGLCLRKDDQVHTLVDTADVYLRPVSRPRPGGTPAPGNPWTRRAPTRPRASRPCSSSASRGSFATVMGFPVERFGELARRLGTAGGVAGHALTARRASGRQQTQASTAHPRTTR